MWRSDGERSQASLILLLCGGDESRGAGQLVTVHVFGRALGRLDRLHLHAKTLGQSWVRGLRAAERSFG